MKMESKQNPGIRWDVAAVLLLIHVGALAAFWPAFFHWYNVAIAFGLSIITGVIGINVCFHRLLTHRSFKAPKFFEYFIALCGTLSLEGGPIRWVAAHRMHHVYTDKQGDPHDANRGFLWTHLAWIYAKESCLSEAELQRYAPDLWKDPFYRFLDRYDFILQLFLFLGLFLVGGWSLLIWGGFVRLVFVYHVTWLVNSASHKFGYRTYDTDDKATNCWWVGLLAWGEGWHNNHHAFPFSARHGLRWYEVDATWLIIRVLQWLRLAKNVRLPTVMMLEHKKSDIMSS